jgi:hypothetical protein
MSENPHPALTMTTRPPVAAPPTPGPWAAKAFWLLLALSLLVALALSIKSGAEIRFVDEQDYLDLARHVAAGHGYVTNSFEPTAFRPPGYPALMFPFAALTSGVLLLKLLNVVFLGLALALIRHLVAQETPAAAWLAGGAALVYPVWLYTASTLYPQTLCLLLLLGIVALLGKAQTGLKDFVLSGVLLGYLILISPSFQLVAPMLAVFVLFWGRHPGVHKLVALTLLTATTVLTISPWLVRNYQVFGQFIPVATNGGYNLLLGNSEWSGPNSGVNVDLSRYDAQVATLNEVQRSQAFQGFAVTWVKEHPAQALTLYLRKVLNYFNFKAELATKENGSAWKDAIMFLSYYPLLVLVLARGCLIRRVPLSRLEGLLLGTYLANALAAAIFFTRIRFRLPFDGLLITLAIISVGHLWASWSDRRQKPLMGRVAS